MYSPWAVMLAEAINPNSHGRTMSQHLDTYDSYRQLKSMCAMPHKSKSHIIVTGLLRKSLRAGLFSIAPFLLNSSRANGELKSTDSPVHFPSFDSDSVFAHHLSGTSIPTRRLLDLPCTILSCRHARTLNESTAMRDIDL